MAAEHGVKDRSISTGGAAYRVIIPRGKIQGDNRALELLDNDVGELSLLESSYLYWDSS